MDRFRFGITNKFYSISGKVCKEWKFQDRQIRCCLNQSKATGRFTKESGNINKSEVKDD